VSERVHAPWLRLLAPTAPGLGEQVVLARVTLDATGAVTALSADGRRLVGVPAERVELRAPRGPAAPPTVDQIPIGELRARTDGGLELNRLVGGTARTALSVDGTTGDVLVPPGAKLGVGLTGPAQRPLHVEGDEVHSGGGFSFADRSAPAFTQAPTAGERWTWFAQDGAARLWSGTDRLTVSASGEGGGLEVGRRMRVHQGGDLSAGIWFNQDGIGDRAFVGMTATDEVGFFGVGPTQWGLKMSVTGQLTTVEGRLNVNGQSCAQSFCNLSDGRLKTDVAELDDPLERLSRLRGVSFNWDPASGGEGPGIGVVAQEVAREFPELVSEMAPSTGSDGRLGVDYSGLTAVLIEGVKALVAENRALRRRVEALEDERAG
jgi:hypothetical protein